MKKGKTNNPNGRPKGVPNKVTKVTREWITTLIDKNRAQIEKDLKALDPKDRVTIIERLLQYVVPKASSVNVSFEQLSDDQLNVLINELTKNINENENEII